MLKGTYPIWLHVSANHQKSDMLFYLINCVY
jgi:hypothetical protein